MLCSASAFKTDYVVRGDGKSVEGLCFGTAVRRFCCVRQGGSVV